MSTTTRQREAVHVRSTHQRGLVILFALYLVLLVWIVLWKLEVPWVGGVNRVIKLVPFVASDGSGASDPLEVAMNFALFIPFGVYLGLLAPAWAWWRVAVVIAAASVLLEATQYLLAVGSSDITDVIVNTAGGMVGFAVLAIARRRLGSRTPRVLMRICLVGTVVALLAGGLFIASPIHFGPPSCTPGASAATAGSGDYCAPGLRGDSDRPLPARR